MSYSVWWKGPTIYNTLTYRTLPGHCIQSPMCNNISRNVSPAPQIGATCTRLHLETTDLRSSTTIFNSLARSAANPLSNSPSYSHPTEIGPTFYQYSISALQNTPFSLQTTNAYIPAQPEIKTALYHARNHMATLPIMQHIYCVKPSYIRPEAIIPLYCIA